MGIMGVFGKKKKSASKPTPLPIEEPQIKRTLLRGPNGKFISQKKRAVMEKKGGVKTRAKKGKEVKKLAGKKTKTTKAKPPVQATFFGKEITKIYDGKKWYFSVEDILALAGPSMPDKKVRKKKTFESVKKNVATTIKNVVCADADGCVKLIREIKGVFPGPLSRWLVESSILPYTSPPIPQDETTTTPTPASNPSDRGM